MCNFEGFAINCYNFMTTRKVISVQHGISISIGVPGNKHYI